MSKTKAGILVDSGFLNSFHTFCAGELSVNVGKFGGWESIAMIDIHQQNGKRFPDRHATPLFSRNNIHLTRPMYGPAFKFIATDLNDVRPILYPQQGIIYPSGFHSTGMTGKFSYGYNLQLRAQTILAKFSMPRHSAKQFADKSARNYLNQWKSSSSTP